MVNISHYFHLRSPRRQKVHIWRLNHQEHIHFHFWGKPRACALRWPFVTEIMLNTSLPPETRSQHGRLWNTHGAWIILRTSNFFPFLTTPSPLLQSVSRPPWPIGHTVLFLFYIYWQYTWHTDLTGSPFRDILRSILESHTPWSLAISAFRNQQSVLPGPTMAPLSGNQPQIALFPTCIDLLDWSRNPASLLQSGSLNIPHFSRLPLRMNFQLMTCLC